MCKNPLVFLATFKIEQVTNFSAQSRHVESLGDQ